MSATHLDQTPALHREPTDQQTQIRRGRLHRPPWVRAIEGTTFAGYLTLVAYGIANHVPWADEVQSWLLARDLSPTGLALHQLRYEGSPGLWQMVLWPFAHAHLPLLTLNIVGAVIASSGVALIIFLSPLPLGLRLLLPFSFYLLYQFAVLSRPYNLLIPIFAGLALVFPQRLKHPIPYTVVLSLMAAVSVPTLLMGATLFLVLLWDGYRAAEHWEDFSGRFGPCILTLLLVYSILLFIVWPPANVTSGPALAHATGVGEAAHAAISIAFSSSFTSTVWINLLLLIALASWLYLRRLLRQFLAPFFVFVCFGAIKFYQPWFAGMIFLLAMFCLWISLASEEPQPHREGRTVRGLMRMSVLVSFLLVIVIQIYWSASALSWESDHAYGPGLGAQQFLARHGLLSDAIATDGEYWPIDLEPYLPGQRFSNLPGPGTFYYFAPLLDFNPRVFQPIINHTPEVLIASPLGLGQTDFGSGSRFSGYRIVAVVGGTVFWPGVRDQSDDLVLYLRDDLSVAAQSRPTR